MYKMFQTSLGDLQQHIAYSKKQWLIPFAVQLIPAGLFFAGLFFLQESPRWLITKGRIEEATKVLCYLRKLPADHPYVRSELDEAIALAERQNVAGGDTLLGPLKTLVTDKGLFKRIAITTTLFMWQNSSGVNAYVRSNIQPTKSITNLRISQNQLLLANDLQFAWHYRPICRIVHYGPFRRCQNHFHGYMAHFSD